MEVVEQRSVSREALTSLARLSSQRASQQASYWTDRLLHGARAPLSSYEVPWCLSLLERRDPKLCDNALSNDDVKTASTPSSESTKLDRENMSENVSK